MGGPAATAARRDQMMRRVRDARRRNLFVGGIGLHNAHCVMTLALLFSYRRPLIGGGATLHSSVDGRHTVGSNSDA